MDKHNLFLSIQICNQDKNHVNNYLDEFFMILIQDKCSILISLLLETPFWLIAFQVFFTLQMHLHQHHKIVQQLNLD